MQVSIKKVDEGIFREFKAQSIREGRTVGQSLTLAMQDWIGKRKQKKVKSILDYKPSRWGKETEHLSEEMDRVLYE